MNPRHNRPNTYYLATSFTHRAKMETTAAKAILKTRGQVAERSFADLKEHRQLRRHTGRTPTRAKTDVAPRRPDFTTWPSSTDKVVQLVQIQVAQQA